MIYKPQLETFLKVADAGSFSKAAANSFITPAAIIKQINLLEEDLNLQLFQRTHRGLILTPAGKSFYQDAKYLLQYAKDSIKRAQNASYETHNVIRIASSPMTPPRILQDLWAKIHLHCPDINFQLVPFENNPENAREILSNLGKNIDIVVGLFNEDIRDEYHNLRLELTKKTLCCAVPLNHKLASNNCLCIEDLYNQTILMPGRNRYQYIDILRDFFEAQHPQIRISDFLMFTTDVFNQCAQSNQLMIAIEDWADVHPLVKIIPVEWNFYSPFGLIYSKTPSDTVNRFINAVRTVIYET